MNAMQQYDVVNNSWGYTDPWGMQFSGDGVGALQYAIDSDAIKTAAADGRDGLGTVMVFSAGNDRAKGYDAGLSELRPIPIPSMSARSIEWVTSAQVSLSIIHSASVARTFWSPHRVPIF